MKKALLFGLCMVLMASFVAAQMPYWDNWWGSATYVYGYWTFDNISNNIIGDRTSLSYNWSWEVFDAHDNNVSSLAVINNSLQPSTNTSGDYTVIAGNFYTPLTMHNTFTFCFWNYLPNSTPAAANMYLPIEFYSTCGTEQFFIGYSKSWTPQYNAPIVAWEYDPDCDLIPDEYIYVRGNESIANNSWAFLCVVKNETGIEVYVNGTIYDNVSYSISNPANVNIALNNLTNVFLGSYLGANIKNFYGRVDEMTYWWSIDLNATDILALYNAGEGWRWYYPNSITENYTLITYEEYETTFTYEILADAELLNRINGVFYWNDTPLTPTVSRTVYNTTHANITFTLDHVAPNITGLSENFEFYWNITFNWSWQDPTWMNSTVLNQTVYRNLIDNCTNGTAIIANFTFFNEAAPSSKLTTSAELVVTYWFTNASITTVYNHTYSGANNYHICMSPNNVSLYADVYMKYNNSNGFVHRFYLFNYSFDNVTDQFSLYNFGNTSGVSNLQLTSRYESNYNFYPNVLAKLLRYYPGENVWRTVQYDLSGDFGNLLFHVVEQKVDYRLVFTDTSNNVLKTTATLKFLCDAGLCTNIVLLNPYTGASATDNLDVTYTFNNATKILNISWVNNIGGTSTINYRVSHEKMGSTVSLCTGTQTGSAGYATCNLTGVESTVYVSVDGDGSLQLGEFISIAVTKLVDVLGKAESAFWSFGIMLTIMMSGLLSPALVVITSMFGLIAIFFLGTFSPLTITFVITSVALGVMISLKVRS